MRSVFETLLKPEWVLSATGHSTEWISTKTRLPYVAKILIPAAFGSILTGLKIGWAFAWRTLIAAELVFGVSSGQGGLGWFIFENRNLLDTANVFAGLATVMAVGLIVEGVIFRTIENKTIRRWGMQHG